MFPFKKKILLNFRMGDVRHFGLWKDEFSDYSHGRGCNPGGGGIICFS